MSDDHYKNLFTNESIAMTKGNSMSTKDHWTFIAGSLIELAGERDDLNTLADSQRELIDSLNNENDSLKQELTRTQGHLDDMTVENARLEEENQALRRGQGRWPEAPTGADKVRASAPGTVWMDNAGQYWQWNGEKVSVRFGRDKEYLGGAVEVWDANWTRVPDMEPI